MGVNIESVPNKGNEIIWVVMAPQAYNVGCVSGGSMALMNLCSLLLLFMNVSLVQLVFAYVVWEMEH